MTSRLKVLVDIVALMLTKYQLSNIESTHCRINKLLKILSQILLSWKWMLFFPRKSSELDLNISFSTCLAVFWAWRAASDKSALIRMFYQIPELVFFGMASLWIIEILHAYACWIFLCSFACLWSQQLSIHATLRLLKQKMPWRGACGKAYR